MYYGSVNVNLNDCDEMELYSICLKSDGVLLEQIRAEQNRTELCFIQLKLMSCADGVRVHNANKQIAKKTKTDKKRVRLLCLCFTALGHFSGHFGRGQLTTPHCSWASLLGSLPVLSAHSFACTCNWQVPFLNQRIMGRRNYFMTNLHERMSPTVRTELATVRIPGRRASDRAIAPGNLVRCYRFIFISPLVDQ